jgi:hypothetical protein
MQQTSVLHSCCTTQQSAVGLLGLAPFENRGVYFGPANAAGARAAAAKSMADRRASFVFIWFGGLWLIGALRFALS